MIVVNGWINFGLGAKSSSCLNVKSIIYFLPFHSASTSALAILYSVAVLLRLYTTYNYTDRLNDRPRPREKSEGFFYMSDVVFLWLFLLDVVKGRLKKKFNYIAHSYSLPLAFFVGLVG